MEQDKDIGFLFKSRIKEVENEVPFDFEMEWESIKPMVKKLNFFNWSLNSFNIYYALLATSVLISIFSFKYLNLTSHSATSKENINQVNGSMNVLSENTSVTHEATADSRVFISSGNSESRENISKQEHLISKAEQNIPQQDGEDNQEKTNITTISSKPDSLAKENSTNSHQITQSVDIQESNPIQTSKQQQAKPIITLNKQDTIIKTDTLKKVKTKRVFR